MEQVIVYENRILKADYNLNIEQAIEIQKIDKRERSNDSITEKKKIHSKRLNETLYKVEESLDNNGKAFLIRPTGFGKTHLMMKICKNYMLNYGKFNKKCLYIYPSNIIGNQIKKYSENKEMIPNKDLLDCMTYIKLSNLINSLDEINEISKFIMKYSLIIFDEAHYIGANNAKKALLKIKPFMDKYNIHYIGATATPKRYDLYNIAEEIFDNSVIDGYYLHDAIGDGIIEKPYYIYAAMTSKMNNKSRQDTNKCTDKGRQETNKHNFSLEISELTNGPTIIKKYINKYVEDKAYMKFICFYPTIKAVYRGKEIIKRMFKEAFPDKQVKVTCIVSELADYIDKNYEVTNEIEQIQNIKRVEGEIHLILAVNMLNMGYHIDDLTGIVMMRQTRSNTIYTQQIGRCMNVASNIKPLIFDFVKNIEIKPLYIKNKTENISGRSNNKIENRNSFTSGVFDIIDLVADLDKLYKKIYYGYVDSELMEKIIDEYTNPNLINAGITLDIICKAYNIDNKYLIEEELRKRDIAIRE